MPSPAPDRELPPPTAPGPLLEWLLQALAPTNRTRIKQFLKHGQVAVNGVPVTRHDHPLRPGDRVTLARVGAAGHQPAGGGGAIVYEDDAVIVTDKPSGLLTVATEAEKLDTAFARLAAYLADRRAGRPFVVHRLDRDTSGLLLFARSVEARDQIQADWESAVKTYLAVVEGRPQPARGIIDDFLTEGRDLKVRSTPPGGAARRAVSRYRVVSTLGRFSLIEVGLETGRKHQIRVHLAGLGCPVIGDEVYGATTNPAGRLGLHAWKLAFDHPENGRRIELESPLPGALRRVVEPGG